MRAGEDSYPKGPATVHGPLFGDGAAEAAPAQAPNPQDYFVRGKRSPTPDELLIAAEIYRAQGRLKPVSLQRLRDDTKLDERSIKGVVAALREEFRMPVGARREQPSGYFWIIDEADQEEATRAYRAQVIAMCRTLRILDSPRRCLELAAQVELELVEGDRG